MKVLVPVDESTQSRKALRYAHETFPDAEITALHVIAADSYWITFVDDSAAAGYESAKKRAEELLDVTRDEIPGIETRIEIGSPAHEIVDYAGKGTFDAVVIGSHGRTGAARILLGSVRKSNGFSSQAERITFC
jgi:nucleotide-binding universal stress UspA family protein